MFKNLFGKKPMEPASDEISDAVNRSTLKMLNHQLFMHYFDANTAPDPDNPAWRNQGLFFWKAKETFDRKSLPPDFKKFEECYFIVNELPPEISVSKGIVAPWFGMPGGGDKYSFVSGENLIPINDLLSSKALTYVQIVVLNRGNLDILNDRENYYLSLDSDTVRYDPNSDKFSFKNKETSLGGAYKKGGVKILRFK